MGKAKTAAPPAMGEVQPPASETPPAALQAPQPASLERLRARRATLQGKPFKTPDDKLMLNALDIMIGMALLRLEDPLSD